MLFGRKRSKNKLQGDGKDDGAEPDDQKKEQEEEEGQERLEEMNAEDANAVEDEAEGGEVSSPVDSS
jgi:hypothetical protein